MIRAHLNGGPHDDTFATVEREKLFVSQLERPGFHPDASPVLRRRFGTYQARLDEFGQFVPHDLESVEFDWRGWGEWQT